MLSILVASCGRTSLARTVLSITSQLAAGDELIVDVNDDSPWGNLARGRMMARARQPWVMFMDDDDIYLPGALATVRGHLQADPRPLPHLYRMKYRLTGAHVWRHKRVELGNVSTQCIVAPAASLGVWGDRYEGDFDFIQSTAARAGGVIWHDDVICRYG